MYLSSALSPASHINSHNEPVYSSLIIRLCRLRNSWDFREWFPRELIHIDVRSLPGGDKSQVSIKLDFTYFLFPPASLLSQQQSALTLSWQERKARLREAALLGSCHSARQLAAHQVSAVNTTLSTPLWSQNTRSCQLSSDQRHGSTLHNTLLSSPSSSSSSSSSSLESISKEYVGLRLEDF